MEEEEVDKNDVVYQFLEKISPPVVKGSSSDVKPKPSAFMYISMDALSAMCDTHHSGDKFIRVCPLVYWSHGNLQLVWRDVLEKLANAKYKPKTVQDLELEKTIDGMFLGYFTFKGVKYFADRVGKKYTVCLAGVR